MFGTQQLTHHDVITHVAFIFISTRMQGFLGPIVRAEKQLFYAWLMIVLETLYGTQQEAENCLMLQNAVYLQHIQMLENLNIHLNFICNFIFSNQLYIYIYIFNSNDMLKK